MKNEVVRIGSRGSKLALWQAHYFESLLDGLDRSHSLTIIKTQGDKIQNLGFDKLEGKGFFTKEIEDALLANEIDVAIHSMKDLPTTQPKGLVIGGISNRANPCDLLIIKKSRYTKENTLKISVNGVIGTSSIRRKVLLSHFQSNVQFKDIRGNVPTRLQKLRDDEELDAIVLAAAGIERLEIDLAEFEVIELNPKEFPSAPAQGVLAYQCREDDIPMRRLLKSLNSRDTLSTVKVERKILKLMDGGCQLPLGAYCYSDHSNSFHCHAAFSKGINEPVKMVKLSQSTVANLAERVVEKLK